MHELLISPSFPNVFIGNPEELNNTVLGIIEKSGFPFLPTASRPESENIVQISNIEIPAQRTVGMGIVFKKCV